MLAFFYLLAYALVFFIFHSLFSIESLLGIIVIGVLSLPVTATVMFFCMSAFYQYTER